MPTSRTEMPCQASPDDLFEATVTDRGTQEMRPTDSFFSRWQIGATAVRHFGRHADALAQGWMRVDGLANVNGIGPHLDRQSDFTDHVTGMGADDAAAQNPAMAVRFRAVVEQQLGEALVTAIGNGSSRGAPGE